MCPYKEKNFYNMIPDEILERKKIMKPLIFTLNYWPRRSEEVNNDNNAKHSNINMKYNSKCDTRSSII